jgi:hypothetical protein
MSPCTSFVPCRVSPPPLLQVVASRSVAGSQSALVASGAGSGSSSQLVKKGSQNQFGTPEVLGMSVGFERPTVVQEQLELEGASRRVECYTLARSSAFVRFN